LQAAFTRALLQADDTVAGAILGDGLAPEARLAIYRHHVFASLTDVLKAAYPVVCRLVDERFFAYAAHHYIRQHPPQGPCLFEYGVALADFLADFPPCRALAYLPDVARLEWAMHAAWYAQDAVPLTLESLQGLAPHVLTEVRLGFDPSVSYVRSPWPVDRIWHANQPAANPSEVLHLAEDGAYLEIRRYDDDVIFRAVEPGTFTFRAALCARRRLESAIEAAVEAAPDFCLPAALQTLFAEKLVVDVTVSVGEDMP
jgi:hypothetical protein